jgi:hypothetical protein
MRCVERVRGVWSAYQHVVTRGATSSRAAHTCLQPGALLRPTAPKKPARATPRVMRHARRPRLLLAPPAPRDATARTGRASRQEQCQERRKHRAKSDKHRKHRAKSDKHRKAPRQERQAPEGTAPRARPTGSRGQSHQCVTARTRQIVTNRRQPVANSSPSCRQRAGTAQNCRPGLHCPPAPPAPPRAWECERMRLIQRLAQRLTRRLAQRLTRVVPGRAACIADSTNHTPQDRRNTDRPRETARLNTNSNKIEPTRTCNRAA